MKAKPRFPDRILAAIHKSMVVGIRAGIQPHRFIAIWAVVVEGRVFVRSWSLKPRSWYRTFLVEPRGTLQIAGRNIAIRAVRTRSRRLWDAVDHGYRGKYNTPGSMMFVRGFRQPKRKATTTELVPMRRK